MQIRIKGYTFQLTAPYAEGHRLTEGEAKALNDLRAENIQNNFRAQVNAQVALTEPGELLPTAVLAQLQSSLTLYDQSYQFNSKTGRSRIGDIEEEARAIAHERITSQLAQTNTVLPQAELDQLVATQAQLPSIIEAARARVAARRSALAGGMDSL